MQAAPALTKVCDHHAVGRPAVERDARAPDLLAVLGPQALAVG